MNKYGYRFSFGPWNIHEGSDPFGPTVRSSISFDEKLKYYGKLGFDAVQFHDDDAVPDMENLSPAQIREKAKSVRKKLEDYGLVAEFVAPRLWEHPSTIDGGYTSNNPKERAHAIERSKRAADIADEIGADLMVLWLAREGTYLRESKNIVKSAGYLMEAVNTILDYNPKIRIAIEPKPNEPMDLAYIPTMGHALSLGMASKDPKRVGVLMESAHSILAGLDPSDEIGYAMYFGKLWSVHLNDQNGAKFDQDRSFASVDLRRAFNQVRILDENRYWEVGMVGLDVKAIRTQPAEIATKHLSNSLEMFLRLVELSRSLDRNKLASLIEARDYEEIDIFILNHLMGK
ncbi:MAG: TIM barrel protein [Chloroflexota bacterium]